MLRLCVLVLAIGIARPAAADPETRATWSFVAGVATALLPLMVGGGVTAASDDQATKRAGIDTFAIGFALAPIVSHLVAHEWKRALVFGALPLACSAASIGLLEGQHDLLDGGGAPSRIAFGALLAVSLAASTVGIIDSLMAGERARARPAKNGIAVAPLLGSRWGVALGGTF